MTQSVAQVQIEEIVVTAQKRPENIQDVPISISAYSGEFLGDSGIHTLQDLSLYTPNLTLSQSSQVANQRITMRGVGSVGDSAIEPSVAVFIDGVYYPRPSSVVGTLSDLELVEVLRGPQGTLFGRNASMGALNITTRPPSRELEGRIRGSFGSFDALRLSGSVSNRISGETSGRLSFHYTGRDGYGKNTFSGKGNDDAFGAWDDFGVRGKLNFTPSETLQINLIADYTEVKNEGGVIEVLADTVLPAYLDTLSLVLNPAGPASGGEVPDTGDSFDYTVNQDHQDAAEDKQAGGVLNINWDVGKYILRSITSYRNWENHTFESALRLPANLLNRVTDYGVETFSHEFQFLSPTGRYLEYILGLYYYNENYDIDQQFDLGPDFCPAIRNVAFAGVFQAALLGGADDATAQAAATGASNASLAQCSGGPQNAAVDTLFNQSLENYALYGHFTLNINEYLRFSGGLRWTADAKEGEYEQLVPNTILLPPSVLNPLAINLRLIDSDPDLALDEDKITWMGNVSYDVNDDIMLFATISTGFKSGGFNSDGANIIIPRIFNAEGVENYELGLKTSLFEGRLVSNMTFFKTVIYDFQDRQFGGVNFIVQNVGQMTQQGLELDMRLQASENFSAMAGLSFLDSEFDSFPNATTLPAVIAGVAAGDNPQDLTGERNHFSPEWQGFFMGEWRDRFGDTRYGYYFRAEAQHVSSQNIGAETNQNPQSIQDAYTLFNARAALTGKNETWEVAAFSRNLTDEGYCQLIANQPLGTTLRLVDPVNLGGMQRCVLGNPRTYGLEAVYRF